MLLDSNGQPILKPNYWDVSVEWGLRLDADTQALYQHMADLLSAVTAVPDDRFNYYSAVNDVNLVIERWGGMVTSVQPAAGGGFIVTVTADPVFLNNSSLTMMSDYSEQYFIDQNNNMRYIGFLDPKNWAGTIPGMANM